MNFKEYDFRLKLRNEFLEKIKNKYNGEYEYPFIDTEYINNRSVITIRCVNHNVIFNNVANGHLHNSGCPLCQREKQAITKEEFLRRAKIVHGDRYDYSKVKWEAANRKVEIVCKTHGSFWQKPHHHTAMRQNCPKCSIQAIVSARAKLNPNYKPRSELYTTLDNYNHWRVIQNKKYPNITFNELTMDNIAQDTKVTYTCSKHGEVSIVVSNMTCNAFKGCKYCSRNSEEKRQIFIEKARKVQGDLVDYSKLDMNDKMPIFICKKHNVEFRQEKRNHIIYRGCKMCIKETATNNQDDYIEKAQRIHKHKYDYSKTIYNGAANKITITCPIHGDIEVIAGEHIRTTRTPVGCKYCTNKSIAESITMDILKHYGIKYIWQFKLEPYNFRWDFILPDVMLNIEVDDDSHLDPKTQEHDRAKEVILRSKGYDIVRINYYRPHKFREAVEKLVLNNIHYYRDGKAFRDFESFCKYYNLPKETTPNDIKEFRLVKK